MKETYLFDMKFNNVIFAHRNKAYGAYVLRREYGKHITAAAFFAILLFATTLAWPLILPTAPNQHQAEAKTKGSGKVILIDQPLLPPPVEQTPKAQAKPAVEQKIKTVRNVTSVVVPDTHPGPDETPPTQNQMEGALAGTQNIDGGLTTSADLTGIDESEGNGNEGSVLAEPSSILDFAEEMPSFEGGDKGLMTYISKNMRYPRQAISAQVEGTVIVSFVVNRYGKVNDATVLKGLGYGTDEEALRVITNMPTWNPGKQNGKPVAVRFTLPIRFNLQR